MSLWSANIAEFERIEDVIERLDPSYPVFCIWPETLEARARQFINDFPGNPLYAVKCNSHPLVLDSFYRAGIRHFDTASLEEIVAVSERFKEARCYFNHPVKIRTHVENACNAHGVDNFVVDHPKELRKLLDIVGEDAVIQVRLAVPSEHAVYCFSEKFGANPECAVELLRAVESSGRKPAISFHVGSQCTDTIAFTKALNLTAEVIGQAGVTPAYINVGGGFPSYYREDVPRLEMYFRAIANEVAVLGFSKDIDLFCEPGRGLVADGCGLIVQVQHRADDRLYINDGIYGCMFECASLETMAPARAFGRKRELSGEMQGFRLFGPTCDPMDQIQHRFEFPGDIDEGDWIEVGVLGAYSIALGTRFNGFGTVVAVAIRGHATYEWGRDEDILGREPQAEVEKNELCEIAYRGHIS